MGGNAGGQPATTTAALRVWVRSFEGGPVLGAFAKKKNIIIVKFEAKIHTPLSHFGV
jgi:hypothetical protein